MKKYLEERLAELKKYKDKCEKFLKSAPDGRLNVRINKNTNQYFQRFKNSSNMIYIKKSNGKLIKTLAQKEYYEKVLKVTEKQIIRLDRVCKKYFDDDIINTYENIHEAKRKFVVPFELGEEDYAIEWFKNKKRIKESLKEKIPDNHALKAIDESKRIITEKEEQVRSKSEKILADKLNIMKIPYIYEMPVYIQGWGYIKPDFLVLNKRTKKEYYWEHFGLMDNEEYSNNAVAKINKMQKDGIVVGKNLIVTFETSEQPLSTKNIACFIEEFLN